MYHGGARYDELAVVCDEVVLDAFPFEILSPGHLRRLGSTPTGAEPLGRGRVVLSIGEPHAWLIDSTTPPADPAKPFTGLSARRRDKRIQAAARELLGPCLLTSDQAHALRRERIAAYLTR